MMAFDWLTAFYGLALGLGGWILKAIWDAVRELREDMKRLQETLPNIYARREDLNEKFDLILQMLREIRESVSKKADK